MKLIKYIVMYIFHIVFVDNLVHADSSQYQNLPDPMVPITVSTTKKVVPSEQETKHPVPTTTPQAPKNALIVSAIAIDHKGKLSCIINDQLLVMGDKFSDYVVTLITAEQVTVVDKDKKEITLTIFE